jgi:predicted ATP-grasp superfamily ATP-dependent carboligase
LALTILIHEWVTGGGLAGSKLPSSWAAEGNAMRRALSREFASIPARVLVTLDQRLPDDPGPWETIRLGPGDEDEVVKAQLATADYALVIAPETNGILERWSTELERLGTRSLGSTSQAIALSGDKLALSKQLRARGITTPESIFIATGTELPANFQYPAVIKPVEGAGGLQTYRVLSSMSFPAQQVQLPERFLLQPFVDGTAMSASYLVDEFGEAHLIAIGQQKIELVDDRFEYRGGWIPSLQLIDIVPLRQAIAAVPGLRGFVGVDFIRKRTTGETTVIEINPRPTTSCVGLCALLPPGLLAQAWLAACGERTVDHEMIFQRLIHKIATSEPVSFQADGTIQRRTPENL